MMNMVAWLAALWNSISTKVASVGVAIIAAVGLYVGHKYRVAKAESTGRKDGVETERNRINVETHKEVSERKERANEVHDDSRNLDDDDLAKRMLEQQKRRQRRR